MKYKFMKPANRLNRLCNCQVQHLT